MEGKPLFIFLSQTLKADQTSKQKQNVVELIIPLSPTNSNIFQRVSVLLLLPAKNPRTKISEAVYKGGDCAIGKTEFKSCVTQGSGLSTYI